MISDEVDDGVKVVKSIMNEWEETNNDAKGEVLKFRTDEEGELRVSMKSFN